VLPGTGGSSSSGNSSSSTTVPPTIDSDHAPLVARFG
jgi:hypothetical protein